MPAEPATEADGMNEEADDTRAAQTKEDGILVVPVRKTLLYASEDETTRENAKVERALVDARVGSAVVRCTTRRDQLSRRRPQDARTPTEEGGADQIGSIVVREHARDPCSIRDGTPDEAEL